MTQAALTLYFEKEWIPFIFAAHGIKTTGRFHVDLFRFSETLSQIQKKSAKTKFFIILYFKTEVKIILDEFKIYQILTLIEDYVFVDYESERQLKRRILRMFDISEFMNLLRFWNSYEIK